MSTNQIDKLFSSSISDFLENYGAPCEDKNSFDQHKIKIVAFDEILVKDWLRSILANNIIPTDPISIPTKALYNAYLSIDAYSYTIDT